MCLNILYTGIKVFEKRGITVNSVCDASRKISCKPAFHKEYMYIVYGIMCSFI